MHEGTQPDLRGATWEKHGTTGDRWALRLRDGSMFVPSDDAHGDAVRGPSVDEPSGVARRGEGRHVVRLVSGAMLDWAAVASGDADPSSIPMSDMWWGMAHENRYCGHVPRRYTVGEHTLLVADLAREMARARGVCERLVVQQALAHDGTEGLGLKDLPSPIKRLPCMAPYRALEHQCHRLVAPMLGIPLDPGEPVTAIVHDADRLALRVEQGALWPEKPALRPDVAPDPERAPEGREVYDRLTAAWSECAP